MKGFAIILLCVVAAVQGRSAGVEPSSRALATLGDNPWVVHLRLAVSTSGLLNSCAGSLIDQSWVLTTASCVQNARFVWIRYGVVSVINPSLVTETSAVRTHPEYTSWSGNNNVALVSINRVVQSTANISPISLTLSVVAPESATFCGFGAEKSGSPGEQLSCFEVSLEKEGEVLNAVSADGDLTRFDIGAPLVSDGVQIGFLTSEDGSFSSPASYIGWIQQESGLRLA